DFMTFVDQLIGSLFWIFILTIIAAISLAFIFSRSLIRPVIRLADYTEAISKNIYTEPVYLNRRDELGTLNTALVDMHHEIRNNEQQNKELLSSIAHEIKNPLGGIEIYTGLLEEELPDNADHKEYLSKIISELQNLKRIILEYLDYARPPKSNLQYQKIDTIISDAVSILKPELEMKNIHCNIVGEGQVVTDESKMRRVLVNLLKNSIEAVERDGQIDISIDEDSENVKIAIRDDGEGIAEAVKAKIFQPHYSTRDRGYGLGLAIVSTIIDELNGTIVVKSEINQGAEFLITLPKQK
ncbi:MAG: HAMP domain-containing histidine kinase, partial [Candidatus Marinimicrobia bacterium]|nr:HAMP domain-containing histidine kinase [Candidatus Neomarinimicrobiota bacterium]